MTQDSLHTAEGQIWKATQEALTELGAAEVAFVVEWPTEMAHGDFAVNAAMAAAKALGKNPRSLADELATRIAEKLGDLAASVSVAGPGFINITLSSESIRSQIAAALATTREDSVVKWGNNLSGAGKRVIVEFSCPNPFKEMHIGHLMSTVIGEPIARLIEASGAEVLRDTYGGDVGPHVAKALWGLREKGISDPATPEELGAAYAHGSRAYEESLEAKEAIDTLNVAIYNGEDAELMDLWRKGKDISVDAFKEIYRLLSTHFDYYFFESETAPIGMRVVKDGLERGVFENSEGAVIYKGEKVGLHTLVFITSRGTPTYEAKDIGLAYLKEERWPNADRSIILTASEQIGHFKVFLAALAEIAPLLAAKTAHVPHGFLTLSTGKMSSREGTIVSARQLIQDVMTKALEKNPDPLIAGVVALGAVKYAILKPSAGSNVVFDFDRSLSLEGDSGPYLQYAVVRAKSILAQESESPDESLPETPYVLERLLVRFPAVVAAAQAELAPHTLVQYLTTLASEWNSFYANEQIRGGAHEAYKRRVAEAFILTMENGLQLLGISVSERM
jgi:arginyl-tRNA synthetase